MTGYRVSTTDLGVRLGDTRALDDVTLDLAPGRIHGLLGRNGAGKTTLLSVLASLRPPTSGTIAVDGADPFEDEHRMARVCLIRESGDVLPTDRVSHTLDWTQRARPTFDRDYAERLLDMFEIDVTKRAHQLSRGQSSAVGVALGLASRAPLTMLDEVHLGMDAYARQRFYDELIADFAAHPRTIILSSHLITEIETLVETVTILHKGRVLLSEEADDVRARGVTLTGPAAAVDRATAGQHVIGTRELGPTRQATLFGELDDAVLARAEGEGVTVGPVPLQDLVIHLTGDDAGAAAARTAPARPAAAHPVPVRPGPANPAGRASHEEARS